MRQGKRKRKLRSKIWHFENMSERTERKTENVNVFQRKETRILWDRELTFQNFRVKNKYYVFEFKWKKILITVSVEWITSKQEQFKKVWWLVKLNFFLIYIESMPYRISCESTMDYPSDDSSWKLSILGKIF